MKKSFPSLLLILLVWMVVPVAAQSSQDIGGTYWVRGTNPGGKGSYRGVATIVKSGDAYRVHWQVGTTYEGVGKLKGKTFQVEWGTQKENIGTVTYALQPDGTLKGTWFVANDPGALGTETLSPKK